MLDLLAQTATDTVVVFNWADVVGMLFAPFLSHVVGLITSKMTPSATKTYLLLALSALYGVLEELAVNSFSGFDWRIALLKWAAAFLLAANTHTYINKNLGIDQRLQAIGVKDRDGDKIPDGIDPEPDRPNTDLVTVQTGERTLVLPASDEEGKHRKDQ